MRARNLFAALFLLASVAYSQAAMSFPAGTPIRVQRYSSELAAIAALECEDGEIPKKAAGVWTCAEDSLGSGSFGETSLSDLVNNQTLWDGANATRTLTLNVSGTDPVITAGNNVINVSTGALQVGGSAVLVASAIGSTVQAYDAQLDTWSGVTPSANGQSLVAAANYAAMRGLLDLEAGTDFYSITAADAAFQPIDSDLTAIAALACEDGEIMKVATGAWDCAADSGAGGGISNVVEDTTPQLGGNLDLNSNDITGTGDIAITGGVAATGAGAFGVDGTTNAQITLHSADADQGTIFAAGDWWTDAVSYVRPATADTAGAFDVMVNGTAAEAHADICGTDIVADSTNFECLELLKLRDGEATVGAKASGTGTVRDLRLQGHGGRLMFGNTSDSSSNGISQMGFTPGNQTSYIWVNNGNSAGYFMGSGGMQFYNVADAGFGWYTNNNSTAKMTLSNAGVLAVGGSNVLLASGIGSTVQAYDAQLDTWATVTPSANGQSLVSAADYAAMKGLLDVDDLITLSGVSAGAANLGTFTGATISDNETVKGALQDLETAMEGISGGISGLTTNTYPRAASSTTIEDGLLEDDGTDVTVNGGLIVTGGINATPGGGEAGFIGLLEGTAATPNTNEIVLYAPADVTTAYGVVLPAAAASGVFMASNAANVVTVSFDNTPDLGTPSAVVLTNATGTAASLTAGLASALAANPTDCTATTRFATSIAADGDLTCSQQIRQAHFKFWGTDTDFVLLDADDELSIFSNQLGSGITITEVTCESDAGTPTFQLQKDDGSPTNMLSSNLTCATTPASTTGFVSTENAIADGNRIDAHIVSAGGTAHWVAVTITYTVD